MSQGGNQEPEVHSEADLFSRYLVGRPATQYVMDKYAGGQRFLLEAGPSPPEDSFGARLLRFAHRGPGHTQIADTYAALFAPYTVLRRKLVLMLAILECAPDTGRVLNRGPAGRRWRTWAHLLWDGIAHAFVLVVAIPILAPQHLHHVLVERLPASNRSND